MSVLKYIKNTPRSPPIGRQALSVIFFSSNSQRGPWQKKGDCRPSPPTGDRGLSPTPGATGACRPSQGRQGPPTLYKPWPPFPCHLSLKIQKKREG